MVGGQQAGGEKPITCGYFGSILRAGLVERAPELLAVADELRISRSRLGLLCVTLQSDD
jgi:hypothetical protein